MKLVVIYGGESLEHDISVQSAFSVLQAVYFEYYTVQSIYIDKEGNWLRRANWEMPPNELAELYVEALKEGSETRYPAEQIQPSDLKEEDAVFFPLLMGRYGENGSIQGLFEILNVPYIGAGVLASACSMDTIMTKLILEKAGIPQIPFISVTERDWRINQQHILERCAGTLLFPVNVKPANTGTKMGTRLVETPEDLAEAIQQTFVYDSRVIVEQALTARKLAVGLLGNEEIRSTLAGEIKREIHDELGEHLLDDPAENHEIPAELSPELMEKAQFYAKRAYEVMNIRGFARCDFFLSNNQELFFYEITTMPSFVYADCLYPKLWENMGLPYGDLLEELLQLAIKIHADKLQNQHKKRA